MKELNLKPNVKLEEQVDILAKYLIENYEHEMGKGTSPNGEGAIEMAVRLLSKHLGQAEEGKTEKEIVKEEQDRILKEGYKLIEWNSKKENQWAGVVHANTTINAIQQLLDKVREPLTASN